MQLGLTFNQTLIWIGFSLILAMQHHIGTSLKWFIVYQVYQPINISTFNQTGLDLFSHKQHHIGSITIHIQPSSHMGIGLILTLAYK